MGKQRKFIKFQIHSRKTCFKLSIFFQSSVELLNVICIEKRVGEYLEEKTLGKFVVEFFCGLIVIFSIIFGLRFIPCKKINKSIRVGVFVILSKA